MNVIQRRSKEKLLAELHDKTLMQIVEFMSAEVEEAYKAGYMRLNAATNECLDQDELDYELANCELDIQSFYAPCSRVESEFPVLGPDSILPNLYKQAKGYDS